MEKIFKFYKEHSFYKNFHGKTLREVLASPAVTKKFNGNTMLHYLAERGFIEVIEHPMFSKIKDDHDENTPMHMFSYYHHKDFGKVLDMPSFYTVKNREGETPEDNLRSNLGKTYNLNYLRFECRLQNGKALSEKEKNFLDERQSFILEHSYALGCEILSQRVMGLKLGMSTERVRQLNLLAKSKLFKAGQEKKITTDSLVKELDLPTRLTNSFYDGETIQFFLDNPKEHRNNFGATSFFQLCTFLEKNGFVIPFAYKDPILNLLAL